MGNLVKVTAWMHERAWFKQILSLDKILNEMAKTAPNNFFINNSGQLQILS